MKVTEIKTTITEFENSDEIPEEFLKLIAESRKSALNSYAPYSNFHVGAAVLLENNEIIAGNNQENAAYPDGLCAERVALFFANANFPKVSVKAIAVSAKNDQGFTQFPVPPCGSCRQVLLETEKRFGKKIKVIVAGEKIVKIIDSASQLLPLNFDSDFLV